MPYVSDAQRRWAHTDSAKKAGFPTKKWDDESRGKKLPERTSRFKSRKQQRRYDRGGGR